MSGSPPQEEDTASKTADQPRGPQPPRPPDDKLFASTQNDIEDINIHMFDISNGKFGLLGYIGTLSAMKYRQLRWAPLKVNGIPVTPCVNPQTNSSSFFIIRLIDSTKPRYKVDLLIRDFDLYFVGFRRELILEPEEQEAQDETKDEKNVGSKIKGKKAAKAAKKTAKKEIKAGWGRWYRFRDREAGLPEYFNATSCGATSTYGACSVEVGGHETFEEILTALGTFDDGNISQERLQRACYSVMVMFCEASRLRSVFYEILFRIVHNRHPSKLSVALTSRINNWKQMGIRVLKARLDRRMDLTKSLDKEFAKKLAFDEGKLWHLIDERDGELLLIKFNGVKLGFTLGEVEEIGQKALKRPTGGPARRIELDFTHEAV